MPRDLSAAEVGRVRAGLSLNVAANLLRVSPRYLRSLERQGPFPFVLASRAAHVYRCPIDHFAKGGRQLPDPRPSGRSAVAR
jgi:hypothetical protein